MPVTLRFQSTGMVPGKGEPVTMAGPSLTIGRGDANDLQLPDPDRIISKNHCAIENHNGNIVVIDLSSNGTFLNYGKVPLGQVSTPLHDGDILSIGAYELVVSITGDAMGARGSQDPMAGLADPAAEAPISPGRADRDAGGLDLLDDPGRSAPGGGGDFLDDLLDGGTGPTGPRAIRQEAFDEDGLLPPLGEDDAPLLGPAADPFAGQGASAQQHGASPLDAFTPRNQAAPVIPEDWDDDLLAPSAESIPESIPAPPATPPLRPAPARPVPPAEPFPPAPSVAPPIASPVEPAATPAAVPPGIASSSPADPFAEDSHPPQPRERPDLPRPQTRHPAAHPAAHPAPPPPAPSAAADAPARAFLAAAGAGDLAIPDAELTDTMARMGRVMALMVGGLREILMTRTSIKSEFRINATMISRGANNPLKFSVSPEQAVEALVRPARQGYLDADAATIEALDDIKAHEVAMVTGMQAAIRGVLARLDPRVLESRIETGGGLTGLLRGRKARYWEVYEKLFAEISDQAENEFHDLFSREFARAYQEQLDRLKGPKP
ncbi:type VI secretion system protein [Rhodobacteraceae bacterium MBR-64]